MPIYEYRCSNGHTFEVTQSMAEDPPETCEVCGASVERVFHPIAVHFKGSGFYTTDYKGKSGGASEGGDSGGSGESQGESKSDSSDSSDSSHSSDSGSSEKKSDSSKSDASKSDSTTKTASAD